MPPTQLHLLLPVLQALLTPAGYLSHHHSNPNCACQTPARGQWGGVAQAGLVGHGGPRGGLPAGPASSRGPPFVPLNAGRLPHQPPHPAPCPPPLPSPTTQGVCTPTPNRAPQLSHHLPPLLGLPLRHSDPCHPTWTPSEGGLLPPPTPLRLPSAVAVARAHLTPSAL